MSKLPKLRGFFLAAWLPLSLAILLPMEGCLKTKKMVSQASSDTDRQAENIGIYSQEQITAVVKGAEPAVTSAVLAIINQNFGHEEAMSAQRRELVVAALYGIAAEIESRKSLLEIEGKRSWIEESQILRVLRALPKQRQFQVPDGSGGVVALDLKWGIQIMPGKLARLSLPGHTHGRLMSEVVAWIRDSLAAAQKTESEGHFRRVPLNFDSFTLGSPGTQADAEWQTLFETLDPLENTDYEFNLSDLLLAEKDQRPKEIRVYSKAALLSALIGQKRVDSSQGYVGIASPSGRVNRVSNASTTCATIAGTGRYFGDEGAWSLDTHMQYVIPWGSKPPSLIERMVRAWAMVTEDYFEQIGPRFEEQQFCIGVVEHFIDSLRL